MTLTHLAGSCAECAYWIDGMCQAARTESVFGQHPTLASYVCGFFKSKPPAEQQEEIEHEDQR